MDATTLTERSDLRNFGLVAGSLFAIVFGAVLPWMSNRPLPMWPWITAGVLAVLALIYPPMLRPVRAVFTAIGHVLGWINSKIMLALIFYFVVAPMGLVMRLFGRDPMARKSNPASSTYRVASVRRPREHMEKPF